MLRGNSAKMQECIFSNPTMDYEITEKLNSKGDIELKLVHRGNSAHTIKINYFQVVDSEGEVIKRVPVDKKLLLIFKERLKRYDPNQAMKIPSVKRKDSNSSFSLAIGTEVNPKSDLINEVIHKRTNQETSFTSTGEKLAWHYPIFNKLKTTGYGSIIRATLTLHQKCSSRCSYCSTIARNKSDSISLDEAKRFVEKLYTEQANYNKLNFTEYNDQYRNLTGTDIRLKGVILSGGGQPNLWPNFSELVEWLSGLDLDIGLITNGFPKNISEEIYNRFKWIRISITPEDASPHYIDGKFENQYIPQSIISNNSLTVGYSYVFGDWTNEQILTRLNNSALENNFNYVRVLTDCNLTRNNQIISHNELSKSLLNLGLVNSDGSPTSKVFHQLKYHSIEKEVQSIFTEGQCLLQSYNVFWDTTGHDEQGFSYCYPCDSVTVLADGDEIINPEVPSRRFDSRKFGTYRNTEVENLYKKPLRNFFDPRQTCKSCLFTRNNKIISEHITNKFNMKDYWDKNSDQPQHLNFP